MRSSIKDRLFGQFSSSYFISIFVANVWQTHKKRRNVCKQEILQVNGLLLYTWTHIIIIYHVFLIHFY